MKELVINDYNLMEQDMEMKVIRVKGLIIDSNNKLILVHNNNTYQFPGGHKNDEETINECITREIKEELGIELLVNEDPFLCIETYDNNYFGTGKKVLNVIYYYRFFTDSKPDLNNTRYDEFELKTDFNIFYINFSNAIEFIKEKVDSKEIDPKIAREMINVFKEYNEIYGGNL
ncbi:MAG: NUDIX hydrolase [Bacilli bacterium]|nr:NUDIX hydrolase [Bacilli bacterium]